MSTPSSPDQAGPHADAAERFRKPDPVDTAEGLDAAAREKTPGELLLEDWSRRRPAPAAPATESVSPGAAEVEYETERVRLPGSHAQPGLEELDRVLERRVAAGWRVSSMAPAGVQELLVLFERGRAEDEEQPATARRPLASPPPTKPWGPEAVLAARGAARPAIESAVDQTDVDGSAPAHDLDDAEEQVEDRRPLSRAAKTALAALIVVLLGAAAALALTGATGTSDRDLRATPPPAGPRDCRSAQPVLDVRGEVTCRTRARTLTIVTRDRPLRLPGTEVRVTGVDREPQAFLVRLRLRNLSDRTAQLPASPSGLYLSLAGRRLEGTLDDGAVALARRETVDATLRIPLDARAMEALARPGRRADLGVVPFGADGSDRLGVVRLGTTG